MVPILRASVSSDAADGDAVTMRIGGAVSVSSVAGIATAILDALGEAGSDLIVDLRAVTFIDSRVVRAFLLVLTQAEEREHAVVVIRPDPAVWRTIQLSGLDGAFPNCADPVDVSRQLGRGHAVEPQAGSPLTPRERRVLLELAGGRTTRGAAIAIGLSPHTVRSHLKSAVRKLGAETRAQAVALAITQGAIAIGAPPAASGRPPAQLGNDAPGRKARSVRTRDPSAG